MLVIGHRGAAGDAPENTIEAMRLGRSAGADILEFDVQLTFDGVPIVVHDSHLLRTHDKLRLIRLSKHKTIQEATRDGFQIATLEELLDEFLGKVFLNLELKDRAAAKQVAKLVNKKYMKKPEDWDTILFSSFKPDALALIRDQCPPAKLGMLHYRNSFTFISLQKQLKFSAVGFHHLYLNKLSLEIAKKAGYFTYVYTLNEPKTIMQLAEMGVDGVVTDHPRKISEYLKTHAL